MTLVQIYRKYPEGVDIAEWSAHITRMIRHRHLGVSQSVTSLLRVLVKDRPGPYRSCYLPAVEQLYDIVVKEDYKEIYLYHDIPVPWLQVNLLRLLQLYPPPTEKGMLATLHGVLDLIMRARTTTSQVDVQQSNAYNAILFEAIRLALHLDTGSVVVARSAVLLGRFLTSRETNVRYLGLVAMSQLARSLTSLAPIQMHQSTIFAALHDRDISVRRRALELVYNMCDETNAHEIVAHLLEYLPRAEPSLRESLVMKISILAERFADDYTWYVDTALSLVNLAGDYVSDAVWHRVVQVVTNNSKVQRYAVATLFHYLEQPTCHETLIKIGGYLLGEFGDLIADRPGSQPIDQLQVLQDRSHMCTISTRVLLLTTYFKWINLYPSMRDPLLSILRMFQQCIDIEVQQRACEYVALAEIATPEMLGLVCEEMPPYVLPETPIGKLMPRKRVQPIAISTGKGAARSSSIRHPPVEPLVSPTTPRSDTVTANTQLPATEVDLLDMRDFEFGSPVAQQGVPTVHAEDWSSFALPDDSNLPEAKREKESLLGLDAVSALPSSFSLQTLYDKRTSSDTERAMSSPSLPSRRGSEQPVSLNSDHTEILSRSSDGAVRPMMNQLNLGGPLHAAPEEPHEIDVLVLPRTMLSPEGVVYRDSDVVVSFTRSPVLALHFKNVSAVGGVLHAVHIAPADGADAEHIHAELDTSPAPLPSGGRVERTVHVACASCFVASPSVRVTLMMRESRVLVFPLPVTLAHFVHPVALAAADFFQRWKAVQVEHGLEAQRIFGIALTPQGELPHAAAVSVVRDAGLAVLDGVDPKPENIVGAGVWKSTRDGPVACLLRYEPSREVRLARLTIRTTNARVSQSLLALLADVLGG